MRLENSDLQISITVQFVLAAHIFKGIKNKKGNLRRRKIEVETFFKGLHIKLCCLLGKPLLSLHKTNSWEIFIVTHKSFKKKKKKPNR